MDNNYNPYVNPEVSGQEEFQDAEVVHSETSNSAYHTQPYQAYQEYQAPPQKKAAGFGTILARTVVIALVFGLIAGGVGLGVLHFGGNALGVFADADDGRDDDDDDEVDDTDEDKDDEEDDVDDVVGDLPSKDNEDYDPIPETGTTTESIVAIMDVSDLVENAMPSIVAITNISESVVQGWGQSYKEEVESCGTGFLVEQDADYIYIATNNHVVEGAKKLTVQFSDSTTVEAEIKGTVASKDLAVIKVALDDISSETLSVIRIAALGDSNVLEVGEGAIAIGNALGYGQSVTTGVVSALGRSVTVTDSSTGTTIVNNNLIQTDAAINPGNSGGALFNVKGEVIGINSVKYSDTSVEGIGYAIPISDAMLIINKLISGEKIDETQSGYLGIQGVDSDYGVYVYKVLEDSAAEEAGLQAGDIIIGFEGNTISTMSQLKELLSYYPAGEKVEFVILRSKGNDYVEKKVTVILGDVSTIQ